MPWNSSPHRDEEQSDILIAKIRDMKMHLISTVSVRLQTFLFFLNLSVNIRLPTSHADNLRCHGQALEESEREHGIEIAALSEKLRIAEDEIQLLHDKTIVYHKPRETTVSRCYLK